MLSIASGGRRVGWLHGCGCVKACISWLRASHRCLRGRSRSLRGLRPIGLIERERPALICQGVECKPLHYGLGGVIGFHNNSCRQHH